MDKRNSVCSLRDSRDKRQERKNWRNSFLRGIGIGTKIREGTEIHHNCFVFISPHTFSSTNILPVFKPSFKGASALTERDLSRVEIEYRT